jgi:hypothetical protein
LALVGVDDGVAEWLGGGALEVCWATGVGDGVDEGVSDGVAVGEATRCFFFTFLVVRRAGGADVATRALGVADGAASPPSVTVPVTCAAVGAARSTTSGLAGEYERTATTPTTVPAETNSARFMAPQTVANDS